MAIKIDIFANLLEVVFKYASYEEAIVKILHRSRHLIQSVLASRFIFSFFQS